MHDLREPRVPDSPASRDHHVAGLDSPTRHRPGSSGRGINRPGTSTCLTSNAALFAPVPRLEQGREWGNWQLATRITGCSQSWGQLMQRPRQRRSWQHLRPSWKPKYYVERRERPHGVRFDNTINWATSSRFWLWSPSW